MAQPLLTISILISNKKEYVKNCLDSVKLLLNELDAELILTDTGCEEYDIENCTIQSKEGCEQCETGFSTVVDDKSECIETNVTNCNIVTDDLKLCYKCNDGYGLNPKGECIKCNDIHATKCSPDSKISYACETDYYLKNDICVSKK